MLKTVKSKLIFTNSLLFIGLCAIVAYSASINESMKNEFNTIYEDRMMPILQINEINKLSILNYRNLPLTYLQQGNQDKATFLQRQKDNRALIHQRKAEYLKTYITPEERKLADAFFETVQEMEQVSLKIEALVVDNQMDYLNKNIQTFATTMMVKQISERSEALIQLQSKVINEIRSRTAKQLDSAFAIQSSTIALFLALGFLMAFITSRSILKDLGAEPSQLKTILQHIASGDLSDSTLQKGFPERSVMASLKKMVMEWDRSMGDVHSVAFSVAGAAEQLSAAAQSISAANNQQSVTVEQAAYSLQNIKEFISNTNKSVQQLKNQIEENNLDVKKRVHQIQDMIQKTQLITKKIGVMDDISYQTNLLAVNAAIEAGRAGENGRAFAVVASEIRKLAGKNQQSAEEIHALSAEITLLSQAAQDSLKTLTDSIDTIAHQMENLSIANLEQTRSIHDINQGVLQISDAVSSSAAATEEMAATSEELAAQSIQLRETMSFFKLTATQKPRPSTYSLTPHPLANGDADFKRFK